MSRRWLFVVLASLWVLLGIVKLPPRPSPVLSVSTPPPPPESPPFRLPFDSPPGLSTWIIGQYYGNTEFAYRYRDSYYDAGQGMHFGIDFTARCGTEVVAIGDGVVFAADDIRRGSGPYNILIRHENGFTSLYGHLLEPTEFYIGQPVKAGEVIGLTGDPDLTCVSRPHLHLEIRQMDYGLVYNPVWFIDADWDSLALLAEDTAFQRDLADPHRWVTPDDQPVIDIRGVPLNDYADPWPPDW